MTSEPFDRADQATPGGLGDRLDDLLLRIEDWLLGVRTVVVTGVVVAVAGAVAWFALTAGEPLEPIEDSIPLASPIPAPPSLAADHPAGGQAGPGPTSAATDPTNSGAGSDPAAEVVVHVVGAVVAPGLVVLAEGDRVSDAVDAAGGGRLDADLDRLNLATLVVDGMQIRVPAAGEGGDDEPTEPLVRWPSATGGGGGPAEGGQAGQESPVDLNEADPVALQRLPGIGPALAARIVAWRSEHGGFATVDDLESVPGIGPAKLEGLRQLVVV